MCPDVLYNGELVHKNYLQWYLDKQANDPEYQRKEEERKKQQKREQQQQYRINKKISESREEKIRAYLRKYHQEFPGEWTAEFTQKMLERANNEFEADRQREEFNKRQEAWLKQSEAQHKKWEEERKQRLEFAKKQPEIEIGMILSGAYVNKPTLSAAPTRSIRHGLALLKEEYDAGKIIRLDEQTHKKLVEFAKPDELILDVMNRLLDIAEEKLRSKSNIQN